MKRYIKTENSDFAKNMDAYINAMASNSKQIISDLRGNTYQIIENIYKLVLLPNHRAVNHWKNEVASKIDHVDKLKSTKTYPKAAQIYEWSYEPKQDCVSDPQYTENVMQDFLQKYHGTTEYTPKDIAEKVDYVCENYFLWLSEALSKKGRVSYAEVYSVLNPLLEEVK